MMFKIAMLNVSRRKKSTALTITITAIAVLAVILISSISMCISSGLQISEERMGADVIIYPNSAKIDDTEFLYSGIAQMVYMDTAVIDNMLPEEDIESITPQFYLQTLPGADCCATDEEFRIVGIDKESDFIVSPWYETQMLENNDMLVGNQGSFQVGMKVLVLGNIFDIVDRIAPTGSSIDQSIFIDIDVARAMAHERFTQDDEYHTFDKGQNLDELVTCYLIKLHDGVSPDDFVEQVKNNGIDAQVASISATRSVLSDQMGNFAKILLAFALIIIILACLALYSQFVNLTAKMQREIGYLRSIGVRKRDVFLMILTQAGMMSAIGGLVGSIIGMLLFGPVISFLQELLVIPVGGWSFGVSVVWVAIGVVFALIICLLASTGPILQSVRMDPTKAISEGEI